MSKVWLEAARQTEGVAIAGLVDLDISRAEARAKEFELGNIATGTDLDAILEKTKPNVVFDVVVPAARHDVAFAAFKHGCHLLTEKPLADSREHALTIVDAARRANRRHAVVQNRRYLAAVRRIRRFLDSGAIGAPTSIHADLRQAIRAPEGQFPVFSRETGNFLRDEFAADCLPRQSSGPIA